jgi:hypothetical protein
VQLFSVWFLQGFRFCRVGIVLPRRGPWGVASQLLSQFAENFAYFFSYSGLLESDSLARASGATHTYPVAELTLLERQLLFSELPSLSNGRAGLSDEASWLQEFHGGRLRRSRERIPTGPCSTRSLFEIAADCALHFGSALLAGQVKDDIGFGNAADQPLRSQIVDNRQTFRTRFRKLFEGIRHAV